ncbi:MAG: hypothetical protein ACO2ZM_08955 [Francisellaceae bacterium]
MFHPTYNINKSYEENYKTGPEIDFAIPEPVKLPGIKIWNHHLASPIGIPAGPLLNSKYIDLYAKLGFDIPVYKTVRTISRDAHMAPNCVFVDSRHMLQEADIGKTIYPLAYQPQSAHDIAITNSFGIPSKPVEIWQADIEKANASLHKDQLMIVSCVGTPLPERDIISDFVLCAQKAAEAGARAIELNFSCPNVVSKEGSIYQDASLSAEISKRVKQVIKTIPLMIKIGYIGNDIEAEKIIKANAPFVDGIAAINTISMQAKQADGQALLPGKGRLNSGICGSIIKDLALAMTRRIAAIRASHKFDFIICGVGGIVSVTDFDDYFTAGADIAMSATGSMWQPLLAQEWKRSMA